MVEPRRGAGLTAAVALLTLATACGGHAGGAQASRVPSSATSSVGAGTSASGSSSSSSSSGMKGATPTAIPTPTASAPATTYDDTSGSTAAKPKNQRRVLTGLPGSASGGCVQVGARTDVRSGALAMGNFADARAKFHATKGAYDADPSFFYVIPTSRTAKHLTVRISGGRGAPVTVHVNHLEDAAQWLYFPVSVKLPHAGRWRFDVVAGAQHGCFEAAFAS
jgi:hypothetical protein